MPGVAPLETTLVLDAWVDGSNGSGWAACCLFFGFLRSEEMTTPEGGEFDPGQHLTVGDITVIL